MNSEEFDRHHHGSLLHKQMLWNPRGSCVINVYHGLTTTGKSKGWFYAINNLYHSCNNGVYGSCKLPRAKKNVSRIIVFSVCTDLTIV